MSEAVKTLTFINIVFVILLMISGSIGGLFGEILYYVAFMIPIAIGFFYSKKLKYKREEVAGVSEPPETVLSFSKDTLRSFLPLIFPTVTLVFLVSLLTSLILSVLGITSPGVEDKGIAMMLIIHALVPAFFEEALFRYIPIKLLLPYSKRWCIVYSALCFSLIHCSFSKMPYAFVAGIAFMLIDVALDSVWPSVILHFINNASSVLLIKYGSNSIFQTSFIAVLLLMSIVSAFFIYKRRMDYAVIFKRAFEKGENCTFGYAPFILVLITCYIAVANAFT